MLSPPPQSFSLKTTSIDEARSHVAGTYAPVSIQPIGSEYELSIRGCVADGLSIVHCSNPTGSLLEHREAEGGYVLYFPCSGSLQIETRRAPVWATANRMAMTDVREQKRSVYARGTELISLFLDTTSMHDALAEETGRPVEARLQLEADFEMPVSTSRALQALSAAVLHASRSESSLLTSGLAWTSLRQAIISGVASSLPQACHSREGVIAARPRHVRRAIEYVRAHAHEPIVLADIAAAASVTPRALQDGFRRFEGTTPMLYLRRLRLARARADLLDPAKSASIAQIASHWGFAHLGLFAARYREAFGELPRETLQRRR